MKKLLLFIAIVTCFLANGQTNVYQPWPADSAMWLLQYYPTLSPPTAYYKATVWLGDTIIGGKTYTKVFTKNGTSSTYTYTGGVRQDIPNEKLYQIGTSGSEYEVFNNQHLAVGDTFPCFLANAVVSNIDSVLIGTKYHKQYNDTIYFTSFSIVRRYIVGVGAILDQSDSYYYSILCYSVDNNTLYGGGPGCALPTNTIGLKLFDYPNEINVYPTLTNGSFTVKSNTTDKLSVDLYDVNGRHVLNTNILGTTDIDANHLDNGIYFVTIKNNFSTTNKKIIIAR